MNTQNQRTSGNRRSRSPRNRRPSGNSRPETRASQPNPKPKGLFAQIAAFIFGSPKPARKSPPTSHPSYKAAEAAEAAASAPRRGRERGRGRDREQEENRTPDRDRQQSSRRSQKPELVEVTSPKLYVGNLSFDATESDLSELFNGVGAVQSAEVVSHRDTERSKGFAFVTMGSTDEAQRAVDTLHDQDFMGRKLVVSGAKTSDVRNYSEENN